MRIRPFLSAAMVTALALTGLPATPTAGVVLPGAPARLPPCQAGRLADTTSGEPATVPGAPAAVPGIHDRAAPPATAPAVPTLGDPAACQARVTRVELAGPGRLPVPRPGYHHLGATTVDEWSAVLGGLAVTDPGVAAGSYDFVAARFLAKQRLDDGRLGWLEVGWAETGWSGDGAQRVYTFDSETSSWVFFEDYEIGTGDRIWVYLHGGTDGDRRVWRAWLWWGGRWHLLSTAELPIGERARLEQYVEVHQDRKRAGPALTVPPVRVDGVRVAPAADSPLEVWRRDTVPTVTPRARSDYCVEWETEYDAWSAGDCTVRE